MSEQEKSAVKSRLPALCRLRWLLTALLLDWNEQFGYRLSKRSGEAFEAVEGRSALPALDEIEEVQGDGCLLRKLFLRQPLCQSDLAQPCAELLPKDAHLSESSRFGSRRTPTQSVCISFAHTLSVW